MSEGKKGAPVWVWLVVLVPIAIAVFGMLSALAIYGVRQYIVNAKQAEARSALVEWSAGIARCGQRDGSLPPTSTPVPIRLREVAGKKYQSVPTEWAEPAHTCAGFTRSEPQYFQYAWEQRSPNDGVVHAVADLDGDGAADHVLDVSITCRSGSCLVGEVKGADGSSVSARRDAAPATDAASYVMNPLLLAYLGVCGLVAIFGGIWLVVAAFQESVGWGFLALLLPCGRLAFVIRHWDKAKRPFAWQMIGFGAFMFGSLIHTAVLLARGDQARFSRAEPTASAADLAAPPAAAAVPIPALTGAAVDLSTVMGRARKLANEWQPDAALLGIEATLSGGKIQTQDGASAKVTFGPSPFDSTQPRAGLFVVTYDKSGIAGAPAKGAAGKTLPEPMCAPEHVLARLTDLGEGPMTLRYAEHTSNRPMWLINPQAEPKRLRLFDPQNCQLRGLLAPRR